MKAIKVPGCLGLAPHHQNSLKFNGFSVVESCSLTQETRGSMFLDDHLILFVLKGVNRLRHGNTEYVVRAQEMVLLKKSIQVEYHKTGDAEQDHLYDSMMFFLKDEFLNDFMKIADIRSVETVEPARVMVKPVKLRLLKFVESIKPYFTEPEEVDAGLLKLKMLELLYDISSSDKNLMQQLLQLRRQVYSNITAVVEENFMNPVSLTDLAYLSGRSLSSFKRDFREIYQAAPAQWIRERRLSKAQELLHNTSLPVTDICYSTGFENVAHFSRLFKAYYGYPPSKRKVSVGA